MPNGKPADNPLTDLTVYGMHPFPPDVEEMLLRIQELGRSIDRWPLGENWPFSPREFDWEHGEDLDGARRDLSHFLRLLESGRGDEIMINPSTRRPLVREP